MNLPTYDRFKHVYIPGKTQHGKTTLMFWMILQDIAAGRGVTLLDGKGDFAPMLLKYIPKSRIDDVIYLDITTPVPIDFMAYEGEREKENLIAELKWLLTKSVEPQHAPIMTANITNLAYTLLNANEDPAMPREQRATFLDFYKFLEYDERRKEILDHLTDPSLKHPWDKERFPTAVERSRITTRMTPFVRSPTLRRIFGSPDPLLNMHDVIKQRKVLIVNLGPVDDIQRTYGTLLLAKLREAALRQSALPKKERTAHFLYCDEFQEFQTSDFPKMLSLAGGLGLSVTLAHQYVEQLEPEIRAAIFGNVSTFICFRLSAASAGCLRGEAPKDWLDYLPTLPVGKALYRAADGSVRWLNTPKPPGQPTADHSAVIRERTIERYGRMNRTARNPSSQITPKMLQLGDDGPTLLPDKTQAPDT